MEPCTGAGMITIQVRVYLKNRVFEVGEQYCYAEKVTKAMQEGCKPCGKHVRITKDFYRLYIDDVQYDIKETFAVESEVPIKQGWEGQSFEDRRESVGDTQFMNNFSKFRIDEDPKKIHKAANQVIDDLRHNDGR